MRTELLTVVVVRSEGSTSTLNQLRGEVIVTSGEIKEIGGVG